MQLKSFLLFFCLIFGGANLCAQTTNALATDSVSGQVQRIDSAAVRRQQTHARFKNLLKENLFLNLNERPIEMPQQIKQHRQHYLLFYVLAGLAFILGLSKYTHPKYFQTLFRVFFNTSLRQSQLTDQLAQAKLSSLFYNSFFTITGGIFIYLLLMQFLPAPQQINWVWIQYSIVTLAIIYFGKYLILQFIGWVTGYRAEASVYIFITFLINKILGIALLPLLIIISFADSFLVKAAMVMGAGLIMLMFLMRYFRSYGLLQHRLKFGRVHFFMFVLALEILPLLVLYKLLTQFLSIN